MLNVKKFYYIDCRESHFIMYPDMFGPKPLPILWHNQGIYGLIPTEVVADFIQRNDHPITVVWNIIWDQTIPVSLRVGDFLTNKQFDHDTEQNEN